MNTETKKKLINQFMNKLPSQPNELAGLPLYYSARISYRWFRTLL